MPFRERLRAVAAHCKRRDVASSLGIGSVVVRPNAIRVGPVDGERPWRFEVLTYPRCRPTPWRPGCVCACAATSLAYGPQFSVAGGR